LRRVEVDTHPNGRDKGIADSPSIGAAPKLRRPWTKARRRPSSGETRAGSTRQPSVGPTAAAASLQKMSQLRCRRHGRTSAEQGRSRRGHRHRGRRATADQLLYKSLTQGDLPPQARRRREASTNGARTNRGGPYSTKAPPPPPRPRRRDTNPRPTSTTPDRRESSGLHRLAKPRGPSEARKTADPAGGDPNACCRLSQEMETLRERTRWLRCWPKVATARQRGTEP